MLETKKIGRKIAEARKKTGLSQAAIAEHLFISPQAVGKWERGESLPDITTLTRLAEILEVDLNYFSEKFASPHPSHGPEGPSSLAKSQDKQTAGVKGPSGWDLSQGNWVEADFSGLKNLNETLSASNMRQCRLTGSDLSGLHLKENHVEDCDFSGTDLVKSQILRTNLVNNKFRDSSLINAEITGSNIGNCDFGSAGFSGAVLAKNYFYDCDFDHVDFTGAALREGVIAGAKSGNNKKNKFENAVWKNTSFSNMQLTDLEFTGIMENCRFESCKFNRITFREVTLKNTFFKNNKNLKRTLFKDCHADRITYEFLKQAKANLEGVGLLAD